MSDKSAKNIINKTLLPITNDKDEIKEPSNDNCNKKKIEECNKKGKVCNPLKNTCVDKNGKTYIDYLKTLKKQKTPPITNDKDEIKEPSNDNCNKKKNRRM